MDPNEGDNVIGFASSDDGLVGGLQYNNVVLLQTRTHKDRVISLGGTREAWKNPSEVGEAAHPVGHLREGGPADDTYQDAYMETPAQDYVLEWSGTSNQWIAKTPMPVARVFANSVVLPDRTVLVMGGQQIGWTNLNTFYWNIPHRFDPGDAPMDLGTWETMAARPLNGAGLPTPRGYHSVALLLQDGRVALVGGQRATKTGENADSSDTAEIYSPPYLFEASRLKITAMQGAVMRYSDTEFCLTVSDPFRVSYAVLMGIASVTHHFDYGARYVELETRTQSNCSGFNVDLVPPTNPAEVPEGFYLLFVIEERAGVRIPCVKARFVKVTF